MKRIYAFLLVAVILFGMAAPIQTVYGVTESSAVAYCGTVVADGNLAEWQAVEEKYDLQNRVVDGTAQTTGYFQVMWDADFLYMAGEIYDATNNGGNDLLKVLFDLDGVSVGDGVVTFADRANAGVHTTSPIGYNPNGGANAWNPLNAWNGYLNPGHTVVAGYDSYVNYAEDAGKYTFEIKWYPSAAMKAKLKAGETIGLDVQWSDYNDGTHANDPAITTIGWSSQLVDWNNDLRTIGSLTLLEQAESAEKQVEIFKGVPTIDGDLTEWADDTRIELSKLTGDGEDSGWIKLKWDEKGIYVGGQIVDANKEDDDILKFVLDFDGVSDADSSVSFGSRNNAGVYSWMMWGYCGNDNNPKNPNPWNPQNTYGNNMAAGTDVLGDGVNLHMMMTQYTQGVYNFEMTLHPNDSLKAKLSEGSTIGFDMQWVDRNQSASLNDTKNTVLGWASNEPGWTGDLRKLGKLMLTQYQKPTDETDYIAATDERLTYLGRWTEEESVKVSYWNAPSVSFDFSGESLYLDLDRKSAIVVELDGVATAYNAVEGIQKIPVTGAGTHSVKIYGPGMHLKGFYVAKGSTVSKTAEKPYYAIFIGDSISEDLRSGTFNAGRVAGWDWTVYALGGIALSDGNGYYHGRGNAWGYYNDGYYAEDPMAGWDGTTRVGMETAFFNYERPIDKASNFTPYNGFEQERQPNAIFIALGVNDYLQNQTQSDEFVSDYAAFVQKLRGYYPNAIIYIVQALNDNGYGLRQASITRAANAICAQDENVVFLADTPQWGVELSSDNTHPSDKGYATVTQKIAQILKNFGAQGVAHDTPALDGDLTEWEGCKQYNLSKISGDAEDSGWFKLKWDENAIYVAGQILDATKEDGDILKFFLDFDGAVSGDHAVAFANRPNAGVYSWMMWGYSGDGSTHTDPKPWNPKDAFGVRMNAGADVLGDGVNSHMLVLNYENGAYTFEMVLYPTDELKAKLTGDTVIGFDLQWVDFNGASSAEDTKITTLGWSSDETCWSTDLRKTSSIKLLQKVHTVTYRLDGEIIAVYNVTHGQNVTNIPQLPERAHYTASWNHDGTNITADTVIDGVYTPNARVDQWNLSLGGDIALNFYLEVADVSKNGAVAEITCENQTHSMPISQLEKTENGTYKLTVHLAAAQMTEPVTLQMVVEDVVVQSKTYTIRQYADRILFGEYSQAIKTLVREMLHYGAAAQNYFVYQKENPANTDIIIGNSVSIPAEMSSSIGVEGRISGLAYYGSSLLFETKTKVRFYLSGDISGCAFQIDGAEKNPVEKDGLWYVESDGINPQSLDESVELTVSSGASTMTVSYSPMHYIVRMNSKGSENLKALLKAMYNYHLAAAKKIVHTDYDQDWSDVSCVVNDLGTWESVDCIDDPSNWTVAFNHTAYNWTDPDDDYDWGVNVIRVGDTYKMWWTRENPWDSIWYAESTDLKNWTNAQCIAGFKHWNDYYPNVKQHIADPAVVYVDGVYYFWFETCATVDEAMAGNGDGIIIHATSTDGIHLNWYGGNDDPQPVLKPADKDMNQGIYGVGMPSVIYKDGKVMMYYYDGKYDVMRLAVSEDGIHFPENANNPIVFDKAGASFTYNTLTGKYLMTVCAASANGTGEAVYVQESEDGINWTCSSWRQLAEKAMVVSGSTVKMRCFADFVKNPYGMVDTATIFMTYTEGDMPAAGDWWMSTNATFEAYFAALNLPEFARRPVETP